MAFCQPVTSWLDIMLHASSEIKSTLKRAALGAGLHIGLAEDLAEAGLLLSQMGLDGAGKMKLFLGALDAQKQGYLHFTSEDMTLDGGSLETQGIAALDMLVASASEKDHRAPYILKATQIDAPLLWFALLLLAANKHQLSINLTLANETIALTANAGLFAKLAGADKLILEASAATDGPALPKASHCEIDVQDWQWLLQLVHKTYVPASARSRETGAGAGLIDSD